ncbi:MAG: hypothetical protein AAF418_05370, partial [Pseudomonadota bacterium]
YPIPGNDDALRAIKLYTNNFAAAILAGIERSLSSSGGYKSSPAGSDQAGPADQTGPADQAGPEDQADAKPNQNASQTVRAVEAEQPAEQPAEAESAQSDQATGE